MQNLYLFSLFVSSNLGLPKDKSITTRTRVAKTFEFLKSPQTVA